MGKWYFLSGNEYSSKYTSPRDKMSFPPFLRYNVHNIKIVKVAMNESDIVIQ